MQPTDGVRMVHTVLNERKQLLLKTENVKEVFFVQKLFRCTILLYCTVPFQYESLLYSSIMYATYLIFPMSLRFVPCPLRKHVSFKTRIHWFSFTHLMTYPHTHNVIVASRLLYFIHACTIHNHKYYVTMNKSMFRQCSEHRMCG